MSKFSAAVFAKLGIEVVIYVSRLILSRFKLKYQKYQNLRNDS